MYACGMSAWGTNQMLRGGGLYRIRYVGKPLTIPVELKTSTNGVKLKFDSSLDTQKVSETKNYMVNTWNLKRSSAYGSNRYDKKTLEVQKAQVLKDGKTVQRFLKDMEPVDGMTISYDILYSNGIPFKGTVQNTIHNLAKE